MVKMIQHCDDIYREKVAVVQWTTSVLLSVLDAVMMADHERYDGLVGYIHCHSIQPFGLGCQFFIFSLSAELFSSAHNPYQYSKP